MTAKNVIAVYSARVRARKALSCIVPTSGLALCHPLPPNKMTLRYLQLTTAVFSCPIARPFFVSNHRGEKVPDFFKFYHGAVKIVLRCRKNSTAVP